MSNNKAKEVLNTGIPFSIDEAVVLLDAYLKGTASSASYTEIATDSSERLRKLAINKGHMIGESYRTPQGLKYQLKQLDAVFKNTLQKNNKVPKVFRSAYDLYQNDSDQYDRILTKANSTIGYDYHIWEVDRINRIQLPSWNVLDENTYQKVSIEETKSSRPFNEEKDPNSSIEGLGNSFLGGRMNTEIQVGKYTLESLTTGMYSDPKIVYREYIQNCVDSLEAAVQSNLLEHQSMRIDIIVDAEKDFISIRDNGTGIKSEIAVPTLMNIGSSQKRHSNNRGFRGIGRLGGMSYCGRLVFTTTAEGDDQKTIVSFDCKKLRKLLVPGANEEMDLATVLENVTQVYKETEKKERHYFIVEMFDVSGFSDLLNIDTVKSYISQVAPLPYKSRQFFYASDLHKFLIENGYEAEEFPIFVGESNSELEPVYKPNRHRFHSDRNKKRNDEILSLRTFRVEVDEELYALGWYGISNWLGSLSEHEISGIRVRKGNILIGDNRTLNSIFKEARFNGWTQGELFVVTDKLIPNARRDDFEQNEPYYKLIDTLQSGIGTEITKIIREASSLRNDNSAKVISEVQKQINEATVTVGEGFNSSVDKNRLLEQLTDAAKTLEKTKVREDLKPKKEKLEKQLAQTIENVDGSSNYKINQVNTGIDKKSKKILAIVSDILSEKLAKPLVDDIIEEIVAVLNGKKE